MRNSGIYFLIVITVLFFASCTGNDKSSAKQSDSSAVIKTVADLDRLIQQNPKESSLWHKRAQFYFNNRQYDKAIDDVKKAISIDTTKVGYYLTLSDCYLVKNQSNLTRQMLLKAIQVDSSNTDALLKLAELHLYVRLYQDALNYVNKALRINENLAKAYFIKGVAYLEIGDTLKAVSSFKTTVEQDQDYYHAYIQLGLLYALKGDPIAVDYYNNALNLNPKSEEAHYNLGQYYLEEEQYNKAIEQFSTVISINPNNKEAHFSLGYIHYEKLKVYSEALKHFINAAKCDPKFFKAFYMVGLTYETIGDINNASKFYSRAIAINPEYIKAKEGLKRVTS
jgi:tetratricopeptide (TPR) repeat protein